MTTYVVPLDGSHCAERALWPAAAVASRTKGGRLLLVTCEHGGDRAGEDYLADRAALYRDAVDVEVRVVPAEPDDGILGAVADAARHGAAMLCMATHGHGGLRSVVLGSVAERVVCRSTEPLLVVGPRSEAVLLPGQKGRMVLCSDGSEHASAALPAAADVARRLELAPWLVEVVPPDEAVAFADEPARNRQVEAADARLADLGREIAGHGVTADHRVLHGADVSGAIVRFAASLPASLVALATHGRSGIARVALGSVAMAVVRQAPCPVLVVRPAGIGPCAPAGDAPG
ncbi:MAG TPA: universal stress protein [Acidimicrobiales bacterium]